MCFSDRSPSAISELSISCGLGAELALDLAPELPHTGPRITLSVGWPCVAFTESCNFLELEKKSSGGKEPDWGTSGLHYSSTSAFWGSDSGQP